MKDIIRIARHCKPPSSVVIGDALDDLESYLPRERVIVITDANVHRHHGDTINRFEHIVIGMGETNKTLRTVEMIYRRLIEMNAGRDCFILGFGGGIVTDVTGFAASTYMRGVKFGFVASTLLAQVDAAIGGKNGVNVEGYKNMAGTFNQPDFVLCDTSLLKTLPERELRAGVAEIIKAGIIADGDLFALFEKYGTKAILDDGSLLVGAITAAVRVKADIVGRDERESDERKLLNLGHTIAHAIEKCSDSCLHGEAVAIGLVMMSDAAAKLGILHSGDAERIRNVVAESGLPTETDVDIKRLLRAITADKKRKGDKIEVVFPAGIGSCETRCMTFDELGQLLITG